MKYRWKSYFSFMLCVCLCVSLCSGALPSLSLQVAASSYNYTSPPSSSGIALLGTVWKYEASNLDNTQVRNMVTGSSGNLFVDPKDANNVVYSYPGYAMGPSWNNNIRLTFVSPYRGMAVISSSTVVRFGGAANIANDAGDGANVAVYVDNERVWPVTNSYQLVNSSINNEFTVPAIKDIVVNEGTTISFVVNFGAGNNWCDTVEWEPSITVNPDSVDVPSDVYTAPPSSSGISALGSLWAYETYNAADNAFSPMVSSSGSKRWQGAADADAFVSTYPNYALNPSSNNGAVLSFISPDKGQATINPATIFRFLGSANVNNDAGDGALLSVFVNDTKIWPYAGQSKRIDASMANEYSFSGIQKIQLNEGDRLRFVVQAGEGNPWCDSVEWPVTLAFTPHAVTTATYTAPPTSLGITDLGVYWRYQATSDTLNYVDMVSSSGAQYYAHPTDSATNVTSYPSYGLAPSGTNAAALTYLVPSSGNLSIQGSTIKRFLGASNVANDAGDGSGLAIYLDDEKIWPASGNYFLISKAINNEYNFTGIENLVVTAGQKLRFVVNHGAGNSWCDVVEWPVTVEMHTQDTIKTYPALKRMQTQINSDYTIRIRKPGGSWQTLTAYNVKTDPDFTQNLSSSDNVDNSPLVSFDTSGGVEIAIQSNIGNVSNALIHPINQALTPTYTSGNEIRFLLPSPKKIAVSFNNTTAVYGDMVYIMAQDLEPYIPNPEDDDVIYMDRGVSYGKSVAVDSFKGEINRVGVYNSTLTVSQVSALYGGTAVSGTAANWALTNSYQDAVSGQYASPVGSTSLSSAACFNGITDGLQTPYLLSRGSSAYSLSAWFKPDEDSFQATRAILGNVVSVMPDKTLSISIADWEFPYQTTATVNPNAWNHVVITKNGTTFMVYLNGTSVGTFTDTAQGNVYLSIGMTSTSTSVALKPGQSLYLAGGAVYRGTVQIFGVSGAAVLGRGLIDMTSQPDSLKDPGVNIRYSSNVLVQGIGLHDAKAFNVHAAKSANIRIEDIYAFSHIGASDGIHMKSSTYIDIKDVFLRLNDDTVSIYGGVGNYMGDSHHITLSNSTLINDAAHAVMMGTHATPNKFETVRDVSVTNIDVVDSKCNIPEYQGVLGINAGNDITVSNINFSNIRIQNFYLNQLYNVRVLFNGYCVTPGKSISNVTFSNIYYNGTNAVTSVIAGYSASRTVDTVSFNNINVNNGKANTLTQALISLGSYTNSVNLQ